MVWVCYYAANTLKQYLIDNNYVETVISLPPNLFYGTTIAVNILVLSKHKNDNKTQFIDASGKDFYKSVTNNNILEGKHIEAIMKIFNNKEDVQYIAKSVEKESIEKENYTLSVSSYVEAEDTREVVDISVLNADIKTTISNIDKLRTKIDKIVAEIEGV